MIDLILTEAIFSCNTTINSQIELMLIAPKIVIIGLFLLIILIIGSYIQIQSDSAERSIRIGVLHSLTGTMADSEKPVADAIMMAMSVELSNSWST